MTLMQFMACTQFSATACQQQHMTRKITCSYALIMGLKKQVKRLCTFHVLVNNHKTSILQAPNNQIILTNVSQMTVVCSNYPPCTISCTDNCIVNQSCKCSLLFHTLFYIHLYTYCHIFITPFNTATVILYQSVIQHKGMVCT